MRGFFAPRIGGRRLNLAIWDWRAIVGRVSATFGTPIEVVLTWEWSEIVAWWSEALDIHSETWGLMPSLLFPRAD